MADLKTTRRTAAPRNAPRVRVPPAPALPGARSVLGMEDLGPSLPLILASARHLKAQGKAGRLPPLLAGKTVLMIYEKNSTRTRVSFEVGVQRLGGVAVNLDAQSSQLSRGESLEDTAQVLSRYADALVYRAKEHANLEALARCATVPVVNALTDLEHPCQVLADLMTLEEHLGDLHGKTLCYVGDGNNMCNSYLLGAALAGMSAQVATPKGYDPDAEILARARSLAEAAGTKVTLSRDVAKAVAGAHAVATDTWVSMGDEKEELQRRKAFQGYTVDDALMEKAAPGALFLHCLPGHWGEEATEAVAHGPRSVIYDEAENRMWVQMALLIHLLQADPAAGQGWPDHPSNPQ
ncbi:MAG TPA: ornithine carbamoyltransferase [Candidatus Thermoplasmatota archaeon]|nr:ornithine carbamoyltransferase [Candidatus Thermoplasmatota archaeon]